MTTIGYHASHEQFAPGRLRDLVVRAEQAGFTAAKTSDHFQPWSEKQGQSGFAWSWLGAAMQATALPFGAISAPGYRYHPAVLAQAAATCAEMFPNRLWLALGSGEAIKEAITGLPWPEKAERNARLGECAAVIRALLDGETVTHRGRVTVIEARLYSRPAAPIPLIGAATSAATARFVGTWADGLLTTTGGDIATMAQDAIVFAMANPQPEVDPAEAAEHATVVATGRSDFANQINNVLVFPGVFRGLMDAQTDHISDEMLLAAAVALSDVVGAEERNPTYIIPSVFNPKVSKAVAQAVEKVARERARTAS